EDLRRSHIDTACIGSHFWQTPFQLPMFSSLPRHGSSPFVKSGNEPGVQEMEISQAGSSQHKQRLRVTNVIGHGPGIKLLNGLAAASTNGDAIYTYRCRLSLSTIHHGRIWTMLKFLTVIGPRRAGRTTPKLGGEPARTKSEQAGWFPCRYWQLREPPRPRLRSGTPPNLGGECPHSNSFTAPMSADCAAV